MEEELNTDIIKTTQLTLGKFVKRPPLTDKLLKKPPFRFLHDIITTVLKTTGFFEGLFEEDELISDNVKDRESKIIFLSKIITVLGITTGKTLSVKPSKIVAGQEPAKTNELLQCLGEVLEKNMSSTDAIRKYKESISINDKKNNETGKVVNKKHDVKKSSTKINDQSVITNEKNQKTVPRLRLKEKTSIKTLSPPKTSQSTTSQKKRIIKNSRNQSTSPSNKSFKKDKTSDPNEIKTSKNTDLTSITNINERKENFDHVKSDDIVEKSQQENKEKHVTNIENKYLDDKAHHKSELEIKEPVKAEETNESDCVDNQKDTQNISVTEEQDKKVNEEMSIIKLDKKESEELKQSSNDSASDSNTINSSEKRPKSVRPPSSRPGAPRVKEKHETTFLASETPIVNKVNIIVENVPEEEEDRSIIIADIQENTEVHSEDQLQLSLNEHGHLVQQILNSQKEFSHISGKSEIVWQFSAQKARDTVNQEIEQMRFNVQALSRISNPLGKLIDHVQEDVEVMRQELQEWTRKYEDTSRELSKQKIINTESLQPLQAKIKQLDADIAEKQDKINDLRIVMYKNYYRIEKLLTSGNVQ